MTNVNILKKELCTGCGLCQNICPVGAIEMKADEEGFLRPVINDKCINCGLCARKCPALSRAITAHNSFKSYAVWSKNNLREQGSSGGVFPALAEYTIKNNGVVFGAGFQDDYRRLKFYKAENKKDLTRLYKSKYFQCDSENVYRDVKEVLETGKQVLFSACPCQVDALKTFLGRDYENLLTVDILCHGVPSPYAYNKFLDEVSSGKEIKRVDFRDKSYGWGTLINVEFKDGTKHLDHYNGNYFKAFLSGISMREGCYHCQYAQTNRVGDITLGDFWGVDKYKEDWNDKKGTSLVMCNTEKGEKALNKVMKDIARIEEVPAETTIEIGKKANGALVRPNAPHPMHKCFFRHLNQGDKFSTALQYAEKSLLDVGIVGWWIETPRSNYGSNLTDFALYKYVESLGLSAAFISPPNFDRNNAGEFNKKYNYRMTMRYPYDKMGENNKYFKSYIVASDTLWYYNAMINSGWTFMLDFASDDKLKISYATSFGNTKNFFPTEEQLKAKYLLSRFNHVGVREFEGVDICKNTFDINATQVMDPVFLCDMSVWEMLENNAERKTKEPFIFSYMLDPNPEKAHELKKLAKKFKCKIVSITDRQNNTEYREEVLKDCGVLSKATIEEFIYHIKNCQFVVTDSFHGFCYSLIFDKPFRCLVNRSRGASRFDTLSSIAGSEEYMIENLNELSHKTKEELLNIDHEKLQKNVKEATRRSQEWLKNALFSEQKQPIIKSEVIMGKELYDTKKALASLTERVKELENNQKK